MTELRQQEREEESQKLIEKKKKKAKGTYKRPAGRVYPWRLAKAGILYGYYDRNRGDPQGFALSVSVC